MITKNICLAAAVAGGLAVATLPFAVASTSPSDEDLQQFLTEGDESDGTVSAWKLECLDALSGRHDDNDNIPLGMLPEIKADCADRFGSIAPRYPAVSEDDLSDPEVAERARVIAANLKAARRAAEALVEIEATRASIAAAETLIAKHAAVCGDIAAVVAEAQADGFSRRYNDYVIVYCEDTGFESQIEEAREAVRLLEESRDLGSVLFKERPDEFVSRYLANAEAALVNVKKELANDRAEREAEIQDITHSLAAARTEGAQLAEDLPGLHETLVKTCAAYGDLFSPYPPWGCEERAQRTHRQWLEDHNAELATLTVEHVMSTNKWLITSAVKDFTKIREEIADAITDLHAARDAQ